MGLVSLPAPLNSMSSANYPKEARLSSPSQFATVFNGKRVLRGALLAVHQNHAQSLPAPEQPRLGIVVAKRFAHHAVSRNTIKRIIRESFRSRRQQLPVRDYIIRLQRKIPDSSLRQLRLTIRAELDMLWDRVQ